jgi:hypothetical protein
MNKDRIGCGVAVALLLGVFVWVYYRGAEKREARERERTTEAESHEAEKRRRDAEKTRRKETVEDLAGRHNAILDWAGVHQRQNGAERVFTLELQDALQKLGDRAIIFVSSVGDVFKMGDGFRILCHYEPYQEGSIYHSDAAWLTRIAPKVTFLLEVDEATARHLVEVHSEPQNEDWYAEPFFAIAVLVQRVTVTLRPEYYAIGTMVEAGTYEVDQETEAEVVEAGLSPRVLITGKCLEMVYLEGHDPFE